jgi:ribosome-associated translation inhibitor RaiA
MNIEVRFVHLDSSDALRDHVVARLRSHLDRLDREVAEARVRFTDVNGPKVGGMRCHVTLSGPHIGQLDAASEQESAYVAADESVDAAVHAVVRELDRRRSMRRAG